MRHLPLGRRSVSVRRLAALAAVAAVVAASCSGSTTNETAPSAADVPREMIALIDSHCTNLPAVGLGGDTLCVDNGFRISDDDFAFGNWGRSTKADANITVQTLVDMFGRSAVCAPGDEGTCILRPSTMQRLEQWNNVLAGGRCEGFAAMSARFFLGMEDPGTYRRGAARVSQLRRGDSGLDEALAYWWATQFLPEVADRAAASRTRTPLRLVDDTIVGLAGGSGLTLGLYDDGAGHAVVPFAVTRRAGAYVIHIYDNNHPGERREVIVDSSTDTWLYPRAMRSPDGTWRDWSGGIGTMELTPMSARRGPFTCDFCAVIPAGKGTVISIASRDPSAPGWLRLDTAAGSLEVTPDGVSNTITGATWTSAKNGTVANLTVRIPDQKVDISVRRTSPKIPAGDVVVNVRRHGHPDIQVQGDVAVGSATPTALLLVRGDGSTVRAPSATPVRVSVADADGLTRTTVAGGGELIVGAIGDDSIEIALKGGGRVASGGISLSDGRVERNVSLDRNRLRVTASQIAPVPVVPQRQPGFTPDRRMSPTTTATTTTTKPVAPDDGPPPSIVVTLPD